MPLQPGSRVGHYEIAAEIGAGGMGVVYRARDSRLGRDVAIKVSAERFSDRFEREARAVAALNHPNICTLHDVGPDYLVMELIEGETLADRLANQSGSPLSTDEALAIARQIASALDAAHDKGIVHRDLKPGNIKIKGDGTVKVLDFGLAKFDALAVGDGSTPRNVTNSPTLGATGVGLIVGTAAYMAPEQARGKDVDKRADIWAFGVVLYEMVTGRRAFDGEDASTILAAVIKTEPQWDNVPRQVRRLIEKCLQKDPAKRLRDIGDAWDLLQEPHALPSPRARSGRLGWITASVFAAAAALAMWAPWHATRAVERPIVRFEVDLGSDVSLPPLLTPTPSSVAISPDGRRIAYVASVGGGPPKLLTRRLDESSVKALAGTDGARNPFFSSDGQWIAFYDGAKLSKISVEGGAVSHIVMSGVFAGSSWTDDDQVLLGTNSGLARVAANGGELTRIAPLGPGETFHATPQLLPGGRAVLMTVYGVPPGVDRATIDVLSLSDHRRQTIARGGVSPRFLSSGHIVYTNRNTMFAMPFDLDTLETRGNPLPVLTDVAYDPAAGLPQYDVSRDGTLVYRLNLPARQQIAEIRWIDSAGKQQPLREMPAEYASIPKVSPDGKKIVMAIREPGAQDVWVYDTGRDALTRLTFGEQAFVDPAWTPDGQYIVVGSIAAGLFWVRADGASRVQPLVPTKTISFPGSFSPDGKRLAYYEVTGSAQIWTVAIEQRDGLKAGTPERFLTSQSSDTWPSFSPDGRWLAYQSDESGRGEVYVRPFGTPTTTGGKWLISNGGGQFPVWSHNGSELLYKSGDRIMSVTYRAEKDSFVTDKPRTWVSALGGAVGFDIAPDGHRVAAMLPVGSQGGARQEHTLVFVQNFLDELRRRVPPSK
jgi:serine/threonine-protein kinase